LIRFPNCKINLGLNIIRKRNDGYHDLETIFYPVGLKDIIEINRISGADRPGAVRFSSSGLGIDGSPRSNLIVKAFSVLRSDFPDLEAPAIYLHKNIPMGAGLGGGSADGAFALMMLNEMFSLGLTHDKLIAYAAKLGSDCPFFILNTPCFGSGRGEILEPIDLDLSAYAFVLVHPGIHISTAAAFSGIRPAVPALSVKEIIRQPINTWKDQLVNDFEPTVFRQYPEMQEIKNALYNAGAVYSSMTGSGSCVYAFFSREQMPALSFKDNYRIYRIF
jgi:4-diphosphocytidyl-2-C-methyl-D-erythritol kinase